MSGDYAIDPRSGLPFYRQIAEKLRADILDGSLAVGSNLPAEADLARQFGVASGTVKQALRLLADDGLISGARGRHWQVLRVQADMGVRYASGQRNYGPADQVEANFTAEHGVSWTDFAAGLEREYRVILAPPRVAQELKLFPGALVYERRWTHSVDGVVIRVAWSYLDAATFKDTILTDIDEPPWPGGTIAQLDALGYRVRRIRETPGLAVTTAEQAALLGVKPGTRVLRRWRTHLHGGIEDVVPFPVETALHLFAKPEAELAYDVNIYRQNSV